MRFVQSLSHHHKFTLFQLKSFQTVHLQFRQAHYPQQPYIICQASFKPIYQKDFPQIPISYTVIVAKHERLQKNLVEKLLLFHIVALFLNSFSFWFHILTTSLMIWCPTYLLSSLFVTMYCKEYLQKKHESYSLFCVF